MRTFPLRSSWDKDRLLKSWTLSLILPDRTSFRKALIFYITHSDANSGTLLTPKWDDGVEYGYDYQQVGAISAIEI
jgi:hypothetical protein